MPDPTDDDDDRADLPEWRREDHDEAQQAVLDQLRADGVID